MLARPKDLPWDEIAARVRSGESTSVIARDYQITRQAIDKRAKKQGWRDPIQANGHDVPITADTREKILDALRNGVPLKIAATSVGTTYNQLLAWRKADMEFSDEVEQARADHLANLHREIFAASGRGDWKAAQAMLQASPETKADWTSKSGRGEGVIKVNVAIRGMWDGEGSPIVDVTPQATETNGK